MKKIVIALDSFKGCLTSAEAGEAAAQGVHAACPECRTIVLPVADGGEGMLDVLLAASNGKRITVRAHDPLMQPCDASYGISGDGNTAFVEMAAISGLPLVPADKRNPMKTTTFGTGELIRDALERGCLRFVIGLGGAPRTMPVWECCKHWDSVSSIKKDTKWEAWKKASPYAVPFYRQSAPLTALPPIPH